MHPRRFALIGGLLMLALGALALVPNLSTYPEWLPLMRVDLSYGMFMGLFAMNVVNKVALIALGIAGILASRAPTTSLPSSINFSRAVAIVAGLTAVLGLIPNTNTLFGYMPLWGYNIGASAVIAALGAYFGFALPMKARKALPEDRRNIRAA